MSELILIGIDFFALPDAETFYCFLWADEGDVMVERREGRFAGQLSKLTAGEWREGAHETVKEKGTLVARHFQITNQPTRSFK